MLVFILLLILFLFLVGAVGGFAVSHLLFLVLIAALAVALAAYFAGAFTRGP